MNNNCISYEEHENEIQMLFWSISKMPTTSQEGNAFYS
jgi:hypothetical protein